MKKLIEVVCCECGAHLGLKTGGTSKHGYVSHGLCKSCLHHFLAQLGMPLPQYLEGIPVPVVAVSSKGTITAANQKAFDLLEKTPDQVQGYNGGDVFDCEYARLPEGCGQTIHCSGCTIRNTVMETMKTGQPLQRVPAYLEQRLNSKSREIELLISTEKKSGLVFLRIEGMKETSLKKKKNSN